MLNVGMRFQVTVIGVGRFLIQRAKQAGSGERVAIGEQLLDGEPPVILVLLRNGARGIAIRIQVTAVRAGEFSSGRQAAAFPAQACGGQVSCVALVARIEPLAGPEGERDARPGHQGIELRKVGRVGEEPFLVGAAHWRTVTSWLS